MILGKEKAANEICQRYADNKLPSSLGFLALGVKSRNSIFTHRKFVDVSEKNTGSVVVGYI